MTRLEILAAACWDGACNPRGIVRELAAIMAEDGTIIHTPEYRIILGQLSFLAGESAGPSDRAVESYRGNLQRAEEAI